jgi:hypothetical protein
MCFAKKKKPFQIPNSQSSPYRHHTTRHSLAPVSRTLAMLPALAATSPTKHASPAVSSLGCYHRHHHGVLLHLRRLPSLAAAGRSRGRLLASAFASADGGAGQVKLSSSYNIPSRHLSICSTKSFTFHLSRRSCG